LWAIILESPPSNALLPFAGFVIQTVRPIDLRKVASGTKR